MYIPRRLEADARTAATEYPIVVITGPRQSEKTTFAKHTYPDKPYVSLDDLDERAFASEDPRGFLARLPDGATIDEMQHVANDLELALIAVDFVRARLCVKSRIPESTQIP